MSFGPGLYWPCSAWCWRQRINFYSQALGSFYFWYLVIRSRGFFFYNFFWKRDIKFSLDFWVCDLILIDILGRWSLERLLKSICTGIRSGFWKSFLMLSIKGLRKCWKAAEPVKHYLTLIIKLNKETRRIIPHCLSFVNANLAQVSSFFVSLFKNWIFYIILFHPWCIMLVGINQFDYTELSKSRMEWWEKTIFFPTIVWFYLFISI